MLRVFTAFSGYDSQCLALNAIGVDYELVGWSEIDKFAIMAHNALFPQWSERNYGDISTIDWSAVPDFDLFTYSSPCQDFSQAGKQRGGEKGSGTRSSLLWECERAIAAKRPKYLLFENVAAVVSKKFIGMFEQWQQTLAQMGYTNFVQVLNAKTHGYPTPVPQNRKRVFMVSILNCKQPFVFPDEQPLQARLRDMLEDSVDEKYYLTDDQIGRFIKHSTPGGCGFKPKTPDETANTLAIQKMNKTDIFVQVAGELTGGAFAKRFKISKRVFNTDGISPTITAGGGGGTETKIQVVGNLQPDSLFSGRTRQQNQIIGIDGVSPAITALHMRHEFKILLGWTRDKLGKILNYHPVAVANAVTSAKRNNTQNYIAEPLNTEDGVCRTIKRTYQQTSKANLERQDSFGATGATDGYRIRKLTPRECFRLMGVQDEQIDILLASGLSNSQLYKMAGNSIVVNCLAAIFRQLFIGDFNTKKKRHFVQLEIQFPKD